MPKQQRMIRVEQRSQLAAIQQLESRSDEELEAETRYKAAAQAILGSRAAERQDAKKARAHFQRAMAAARPQERMYIRRQAEAALAFAERRADDYAEAVERMGGEVPTGWSLFGLRLLGLIAPPASAGILARIRGILLAIALFLLILGVGFGIVYGIGTAAGGISIGFALFWGFILMLIVLAVVSYIGRRRQKRARAKRSEEIAARSG
jgi:ABC-type multidrug transport system fused ATPase/permease subunit